VDAGGGVTIEKLAKVPMPFGARAVSIPLEEDNIVFKCTNACLDEGC